MARRSTLTTREQEVLWLVAQGLTNRQIAFHLQASVRTIDVHVRNIFDALGANNRAHAVFLFYLCEKSAIPHR